MNNNKILNNIGLTFDDVLIVPDYTDVKREEIDISIRLTSDIKLKLPFMSSPMDTVTTSFMAIALGKLGGLGVIHRNLTIKDQVEEVKKAKKETSLVAAAVGVGRDLKERAEVLSRAGIDVVVIDSAHGHSKFVIEATRYVSEKHKNITLVAGNVVTGEAARVLIEAGAQVLRVGMGPGSICTTRIIAGIGTPQITAIMKVAKVAKEHNISVIADGGLRLSGDIVKALTVGGDCIMSGSLFAGTDEAPGEVVIIDGKKYKSYRGMGSVAAMKEGSAARYGQEYRKGQEKKLITEGVEGLVPYKGSLESVVNQLVGGLRTGMYYAGARNIRELQEKAKFIRVSQASLIESHPHNILIKASGD